MSRAELFRVLGDPTRLRILALLTREELAVSEIQEVAGVGQSTVSGHLAQLKGVGLVTARRDGAHTRYAAATPEGEGNVLRFVADAPLPEGDAIALQRVLAERESPTPEGLGSDYLPGRSWEALAHLLLSLVPPMRIADLGVGTGRLTALLAGHARQVIAVDRDAAALERLPAGIERRLGTLEEPPLGEREVDLVLLSQALHCVADPVATLRRCREALVGGGKIAVLDLAPHTHAWVEHRLGHAHLGFADLGALLTEAGFHNVTSRVVHVDRRSPAFTTVLAIGVR
ncbi:MAG: metalloregulator ArsR/SmtB family transcription factor [Deltaproteobacteria bacterium]|nr:metalloregulator ArsR/SmtB family transcription factor [Deltaproteobacteria bacterium]